MTQAIQLANALTMQRGITFSQHLAILDDAGDLIDFIGAHLALEVVENLPGQPCDCDADNLAIELTTENGGISVTPVTIDGVTYNVTLAMSADDTKNIEEQSTRFRLVQTQGTSPQVVNLLVYGKFIIECF